MIDFDSFRKRGFFVGLAALLIALWFLRVAFKLTGAALRIILLVAGAFLLFAWVTSAVGRGRRH